MSYEPKDGDITIFKNDKRTSDNQPTHRGTIYWNGEKLKISLWPKQGANVTFLGGKVQIDDYVPQASVPASAVDDFITSDAPPASAPAPSEPTDSDLPF